MSAVAPRILAQPLRVTLRLLGEKSVYRGRGKRDLRIDFLRGLAVAAMVVDHIGGATPLTALTGDNSSLVSAAEAFVFLSGTVLGMVNSQRVTVDGMRGAARKLLSRAWTLYSASVGLATAFYALYLSTSLRLWGDPSSEVTDPPGELLQILTLRRAFHGSDVLIMYALMLFAAPAVVYLLHRKQAYLVLGTSLALWLLQQFPLGVSTELWPVAGSSFPLFSWQLLMVVGLVVGFHYRALSAWLLDRRRAPFVIAGAFALFSAMMVLYRHQEARFASSGVEAPTVFPNLFDKPNLGPGRVLAFLCLALMAFSLVHFAWTPLKSWLGWFFLPLGQNSLYVYITHLFVLVALYNVAPPLIYAVPLRFDPLETIDFGSQLVALAAVWLMVKSRFLFWLVPR